jgi:hypothetical protein
VTTTNTRTSSNTKSNTPAIAGGVAGGVVALIAVIGIIVFVRRRGRRGRPLLSGPMEDGSPVIITPFESIPSAATLGSPNWTEQLPHSQPVAPVPNGLSDKEIARLRARNLDFQPSHNPSTNESTSNVSQSMSSPIVVSEPSGATSAYDPRRLQSEVESLRREMEVLRTVGMATGAPPSYTEGDG